VDRRSIGIALAAVAAALGVVAIVMRPFLFAPIGLLVLAVAAKVTGEKRVTTPAAYVLALGALAGAAIAVGFTKPLY
jgi:hypothetical protein